MTQALEILIESIYIPYAGCIIERHCNEFTVFGETFPTLEDAQKYIDLTLQILGRSIRCSKK